MILPPAEPERNQSFELLAFLDRPDPVTGQGCSRGLGYTDAVARRVAVFIFWSIAPFPKLCLIGELVYRSWSQGRCIFGTRFKQKDDWVPCLRLDLAPCMPLLVSL